MIKLYAWTTPNGYKPAIMLEELGLKYELEMVDITTGDQMKPSYLKLNPNNKIPTLVDGKTVIFESGAILIYLAEKYGKFLPSKGTKRYEVLEWLMFQMASVGPMFGQATHFTKHAPEKIPYAIERYTSEAVRIMHVLESKLRKSDYLAGTYSIADMATYPWIRAMEKNIDFKKYPGLSKWYKRMEERPATGKAIYKVTTARGEKK